jgi:ABC-type transport system substrate-binding protein
MPDDSTYWDKFWRKRMGRRRLISGAMLASGGLAAATLVGCGGESTSTPSDDDDDGNGNGNGNGSPGNAGERYLALEYDKPVDGRQTFTPAPQDSRGDFLTYIGFDAVVLDRYDPHQTQFGPMYSNQSAIFSKLYRYASHEEPVWDNIYPDLAESAPEMIGGDAPDEYVITLRKGVKFHDTDKIRSNFPDLAGRELTADDVLYSYNRQRNADSPQRTYYYRSSQYETIETIEAVDDYTIRIKTDGPVAPFFHFMADTNAMIIPQEIVDMGDGPTGAPWDSVDPFGTGKIPPADRMIGTGPFIWDNLTFGIEFRAIRNPECFGWYDKSLGRP